jgi:hypothetical protein
MYDVQDYRGWFFYNNADHSAICEGWHITNIWK